MGERAGEGSGGARSGADHDHIGRRLRTLEECALHKRTLRLTCPACGHVRVLDAVALWWLFQRRGWDGTLGLVGRRLCCSACRAAGQVRRPRLAIGRDPPTGAALPYPDAATWKRLVSRYRS
ncbi:hypothetical protein [Sphingomonas abaci]|uniref:Uncharacterized protein n=1 Tax=Sphingomonas abaci TaxID=237611 RepID=A0A7W7EX59_9SPHN|nr:hypothetical protein [Sphingomonas abaci]MBB4617267.1 hypothetical protein [Sphingomonas abaci]